MGKINQGILGGVSGKVGGVVGTSWKGIAVLKAMPISVANPKTAAQVSNRDRNTAVLRFAQSVGTTFIRTYWNRFAKKMSGFNDFMSVNSESFNPLTSMYQNDKMFASVGKLTPINIGNFTANKSGNVLLAFTARSASSDYVAGDIVDVVVFNADKQDAYVLMDQLAAANHAQFACPAAWEIGDVLMGFISCRRADGTAVSTSSTSTVEIA